MKEIEILAVCSEMAAKYGDNYEIVDLTYNDQAEELSFHPNGKCGCIQSNYSSVFGIQCNHLMWAEGNCEGIEPFWNELDVAVAESKYKFHEEDGFNAIIVYGNHKGLLRTKLIVFHEK